MAFKRAPKWRRINRPSGSVSLKTQGFPNALEQAIADAELLINYAGRFGVDVEYKVLRAIARARELFNRGQLRGEVAADFYQKFIALSKAVCPVTVRSLRSCIIEQESRTWIFLRCKETPADQALNRHRRWGFAGLLFLTVIQTYWVIGSFLTTNLPILSDDEKQFEHAVEERARWTRNDVSQPTTQDTAVPQGADQKREQAEESELKKEEQGMLRGKSDTYLWLLDVWTAPGLKAAGFFDSIFQQPHGDHSASAAWKTGIVAKYILNILQTYVLPPLYGWLGAMAYVLRRLISEINARTYHSDSDTSYNLRIYLGVLAGLAIGWFVAPDNKAGGNVLQALSPLALAFLAGYSVELLFSAMDRLLEAFSAKAPSAKVS